MKKTMIALFAGIMLFTLGACGSKNKESKSKGGDSTTIRVSWWGDDNRHSATIEALKNYEKEGNVTIKSEYNGYNPYQEKLTTQLAGNTEPDLMQINYDWYPTFSKDGTGFYNLYDLKDEIDLSQYDKKFLKMGEVDGKLNGIPYGQNTLTFAINKTKYEELGVAVPKTWDDLVAAAKKFPKGSFPVLPANPMFVILTYLQQETGKSLLSEKDAVQFTQEELKSGLKWYKEMVDAGVFVSRENYLENVGSDYTSVAQNQKFLSGEYAGIIDWTGALDSYSATLKEQNQELEVISMPQTSNAKITGTISKPTMFFSISKNTKDPKKVAKLLNYLLNDESAIKTLKLTRGVPASKAAISVLQKNGILEGIAKDAFEYGESVKSLAERPKSENQTIQTAFKEELERYELNQSNMDTTSKQLYSRIEDALK